MLNQQASVFLFMLFLTITDDVLGGWSAHGDVLGSAGHHLRAEMCIVSIYCIVTGVFLHTRHCRNCKENVVFSE